MTNYKIEASYTDDSIRMPDIDFELEKGQEAGLDNAAILFENIDGVLHLVSNDNTATIRIGGKNVTEMPLCLNLSSNASIFLREWSFRISAIDSLKKTLELLFSLDAPEFVRELALDMIQLSGVQLPSNGRLPKNALFLRSFPYIVDKAATEEGVTQRTDGKWTGLLFEFGMEISEAMVGDPNSSAHRTLLDCQKKEQTQAIAGARKSLI